MDLFETIHGHRSIRSYKPDPVDESLLTEVLSAGVRASSSGNMQTFSIIVTADEAMREKLYWPHMEQEMVRQAMREGAWGLSAGLEYGGYNEVVTTEEVIAVRHGPHRMR